MIIRRLVITVGHLLPGITETILHRLPVFARESMMTIGVDLLCLIARDTHHPLQTTEVAILRLLMQIIVATVALLCLPRLLTMIAMKEELVVRDSLLDTCLLGVGARGLHRGTGKILRECLPIGECLLVGS